VRARIMVPVAAVFAVGAFGVFALFLRTRLGVLGSEELFANAEKERLGPAHRTYLALRSETEDTQAGLKQLGFFRCARNPWGEVLMALPDRVPASVQFTLLQHSYPPQPSASPLAPLPAPTNRVESGTVLLRGRTSNTEEVGALLEALGRPPFDALFAKAEIPPGAIKQELRREPGEPETLLFDIEIACHPRRFE
jgi:hypothetical protein